MYKYVKRGMDLVMAILLLIVGILLLYKYQDRFILYV